MPPTLYVHFALHTRQLKASITDQQFLSSKSHKNNFSEYTLSPFPREDNKNKVNSYDFHS
jgi:hypothetical protein